MGPPEQSLELPPKPHATDVEAGLGVGLLHGFHGLADTWVPMARISIGLFESALSALPLALRARLSVGVGAPRSVVSGRPQRRHPTVVRHAGCAGAFRARVRGAAVPLAWRRRLRAGHRWRRCSSIPELPPPNLVWAKHSRRWGVRGEPCKALSRWLLTRRSMDVWSETVVKFGSQEVIHQGAPIALFGVAASGVF